MSAAWILAAARTPRGVQADLDAVASPVAATLLADRSGRREPGLVVGAGASGRRLAWAAGLGATTVGTDGHAGGLSALASLVPAVAGGWTPQALVAAVPGQSPPGGDSRRIQTRLAEADWATAAARVQERLQVSPDELVEWLELAQDHRTACPKRPRTADAPDLVVPVGLWAPERPAAAAVRVVSESVLSSFTLPPRARIAGATWGACDPADPWQAPTLALEAALEAAGLHPESCQALCVDAPHPALLAAVQRALNVPRERINPDGGCLARGRAGAAEGLCLLVDLLDWLEEQDLRYGACVELLPDGGAAAVVVDGEAWA